jgi:hypothetical protein
MSNAGLIKMAIQINIEWLVQTSSNKNSTCIKYLSMTCGADHLLA